MDTPNPFIGAKYEETKNLDITDIAKLVRKEIKETFPELKTSITTERYSMGRSLSVVVKESPVPLKNPLYDSEFVWSIRVGKITSWNDEDNAKREYMTEEGKRVESAIKDIIGQYNFDDSDAMTDYFHVAFHSGVRIEC